MAIIVGVSAAQASLTFSLGNGNSATAYVASGATSLQAIGKYIFNGKQTVVGTNTGDNYVLLTTAAATATAGEVTVEILYVTD